MPRWTILMLPLLLAAAAVTAAPAPEPVHYTKLIPLLPDKVEGFVAETPGGSTAAAMGFKLTEVSRTYHQAKDDAAEKVTVKITDGAGNQFFAAAHGNMGKFNQENEDGFSKGFTLDGYPAVETYTNESKEGALTIFIAPRYLIEITSSGLASTVLEDW